MILDKGICDIYTVSNTASAGNKPIQKLTLKCQAWYAELDFATTPKQAAGQEAVAISERIRILQNREVANQNVVIIGTVQYNVTRAFHGTDEESGQPITDLTLERLVQNYAV